MEQTYNIKDLRKAVIRYETEINKREFIEEFDKSPFISVYKSGRFVRFAAILTSNMPKIGINTIFKCISGMFDKYPNASDTVDVFAVSVIDRESAFQLKEQAIADFSLGMELIDRSRMEEIPIFNDVFNASLQVEDDFSFVERTLYDYLACSEDSSYLKSSLYYSLILLCVYNSVSGLSKHEIDDIIFEKFGNRIDNIDNVIKTLIKDGHLAPQTKGGTKLVLTPGEKDKIFDSIQKSRRSAQEFTEKFEDIVKKYNVHNSETLLACLRNAILYVYEGTIDSDDASSKDEMPGEYISEIKSYVPVDQQESFFADIRLLLKDSQYLNRVCKSNKFLDLYRSDRYERYINGKTNVIFMDTMVFINCICFKSEYSEIYEPWPDNDFLRVRDLCEYVKNNSGKFDILVPNDYLEETVGELRKALQLTWFSNIDLPISLKTSNTFFNFYQYIRSNFEPNLSFIKFLSKLGFRDFEPNSIYFKRHTMEVLTTMLNTFNFSTIGKHPQYVGFDAVKNDYIYSLAENYRKKSDAAINADVRIAYYLADKYAGSCEADKEYYLTSWDKTLTLLRTEVNDKLGIKRSFYIKAPGELLQALSLKTFKIDKGQISLDVFAYADENYGFGDKVTSLFDNVLNPYFATSANNNTELVKVLLSLEDLNVAESESSEMSSRGFERTTFEDIFLIIIESLPKNNCSSADLRSFLSDQNNNSFIIDFFKTAYQQDSKQNMVNMSYQFIDELKRFICSNQAHDN